MADPFWRIRSVGGNKTFHWGTSYDGNGGNGTGSLPDDYFSAVRFTEYSRIEDVGGKVYVRNTHRYPATRCTHFTMRNWSTALRPFANDNGGHEYPKGAYPAISVEMVQSMVPVFPDSLRSELLEEAFNTFSDRFPQQISFTEFLGGLGELKDLIPKIESSFTRTSAGLFLNKKFGWDNLLQDLRAMSLMCKAMQKRLTFLAKTYGVPTRLGFYRGNVYAPSAPSDVYLDMASPFGYAFRLVFDGYRADFRATCWLLQKLDHLNDIVGLIRELTGALGLNNPLKAAWVVLPGSFIVDWVFKVSQHLDRLGKIVPSEEWDVRDPTFSIRARTNLKVIQDPRSRNGSNSLTFLGPVSVDEYIRDIGFPIGLDVYNPADLSPSQLTLLLALIGANT